MKAVIDCNSFYCSCERLFRPDLSRRPVVVLSNNDGCIISRTDEARALGIAMASPYYLNKSIIEQNQVAVFSSNYHLYGDLSLRVMDTLRELAGPDKVEVYSVDEAFVDLDMVPERGLEKAARQFRDTVEQWTGIKVSIGMAPTKVLCKVANRLAKKNKEITGCIMILDSEEKITTALKQTPVSDLWGVGRQYANKLRELHGIENAWQLRSRPESWAARHLGGVTGRRLIRELKGESCVPLKKPLENKKMIATTRMFGQPVFDLNPLKEAVATYTARAAEKLRRQYSAASSLDVFVVTNENEPTYQYHPKTNQLTVTLPQATSNTLELVKHAVPLIERLYRKGPKYLKAGVILGKLVPDSSIQASLYRPEKENITRFLMEAIDNINFSMRDDKVKTVASGIDRNWKMRQELRSPRFTTRWKELYEIS